MLVFADPREQQIIFKDFKINSSERSSVEQNKNPLFYLIDNNPKTMWVYNDEKQSKVKQSEPENIQLEFVLLDNDKLSARE